MTNTIEYRPLPISTEDLLRLKAAAGDRDRNLQLDLVHTDVGEDYIEVMIKGAAAPFYTVRRAETETGKPCWLMHHDDGPMHEFQATSEVAAFLASGDARLCKRSWMTRHSEPGRIVGGGRPALKRKDTPGIEAMPGRRGRSLPM